MTELEQQRSFGPSALATPANAVTMARVAITPVLLGLILAEVSAAILVPFWVLMASTDGLDGWLARRHGTTRSGAFLDPLADKFLVIGAMTCLVFIDDFWWLPVGVIATREIGLTCYRSWLGRRGVSVPARYWAKVKTVVQSVAVGLALLPEAALFVALANVVLWVAVTLTVVTGVQYLLDGRQATAQ